MTHDELLAKIGEPKDFAGIKYAPDWQSKALRAVVELHKLDQYGCTHCEDINGTCPTIEAIEKELQ